MLEKELASALKSLMGSIEWICLSTVNEKGIPETRLMANLANNNLFPALGAFFDDSFVTYFTTSARTDKMKQLALNDNASVYYYDAAKMQSLILLGKLEIVADEKMKEAFWQDNWTMFFPKGRNDPDYSLLKFTPSSYKYAGSLHEYKKGDF